MTPHDLVRKKRVDGTDTYLAPAHGWTCFHCGDHFPCSDAGERAAREHFGPTPDWSPLCIERKTISDDALLLMSRRARADAAKFLQERHEAEEEAEVAHAKLGALWQFPARSVHDAFNMYHSMEGRALAAESILKAATKFAPDAVAQARVEVCGPEPEVSAIVEKDAS